MAETRFFELGPVRLASGVTLPEARIAYAVHGEPDRARSNLVLYPTSYGAHHTDVDWLVGKGRILDPARFCVVIVNQLGNGLSTSPSNLPDPFAKGRAPAFSHLDNLAAQERLVDEVFGATRLAMAYGWSMGGQQALHWAALRPEKVERVLVTCTSARTSPHNRLFLEGLRAALCADPCWNGAWFEGRPLRGLRAFARIYAGWAMSQAFYREEMWRGAGYASYEDWIVRAWEGNFLRRDPMDLLSMIDTWIRSDVSDNEIFRGDLGAAVGAIRARVVNMPSTTDLYFTEEDARIETAMIPGARLVPIRSLWGHRAGNPILSPEDEAAIRAEAEALLADA